MAAPYAEGIVCPACKGDIVDQGSSWYCHACERCYPIEDGVPNLIVGERFPDDGIGDLLDYEERANEACARDFYLPWLSRLLGPTTGRAPRIASIGCGSGLDVEVLSAEGFDAIGFDCGYRNRVWGRRAVPDRFLLARGEKAPFRDGWFDAAIMGCVFPHVGVVGDSFEVGPSYREERIGLAREVARILRPSGHLLVSSPNRRFPFDLFHRYDPKRRVPRPNRPSDPFLLSFSDYDELFLAGAGCRAVESISIDGYWGFVNMSASAKTRALRAGLRGWFRTISSTAWLRSSGVAPWLCLHVTR